MNYRKWLNKYSIDCKSKYNSVSTQNNYTSCVKSFLKYFSNYKEPKEIPTYSIKEYLLEFKTLNTRKHNLCAIKSFYVLTVRMPKKINKIPYPKSEKKLPRVINKEFLITQISKIRNLKHKAIIMLAYSTGMRVSEVCNLKIKDIDSKKMVIYVNQAKGRKDRMVPLSQKTLITLRAYFKEYKPKKYLFNGQSSPQYSANSCNQIVKKYLGKAYHFHLLRHSSFTTMLESGVDLRVIQHIAGHNSSKTTEIYTHISTNFLKQVRTPI